MRLWEQGLFIASYLSINRWLVQSLIYIFLSCLFIYFVFFRYLFVATLSLDALYDCVTLVFRSCIPCKRACQEAGHGCKSSVIAKRCLSIITRFFFIWSLCFVMFERNVSQKSQVSPRAVNKSSSVYLWRDAWENLFSNACIFFGISGQTVHTGWALGVSSTRASLR